MPVANHSNVAKPGARSRELGVALPKPRRQNALPAHSSPLIPLNRLIRCWPRLATGRPDEIANAVLWQLL